MVLKFGSLIVSTIVCISLESVVAYRTHGENQYTFPQNDRIAFPEGTRQRPAIEVEYFENGTTIARYADGTPVVRPDTATGLLPTESNPRLSGIKSVFHRIWTFGLINFVYICRQHTTSWRQHQRIVTSNQTEMPFHRRHQFVLYTSPKLSAIIHREFGALECGHNSIQKWQIGQWIGSAFRWISQRWSIVRVQRRSYLSTEWRHTWWHSIFHCEHAATARRSGWKMSRSRSTVFVENFPSTRL